MTEQGDALPPPMPDDPFAAPPEPPSTAPAGRGCAIAFGAAVALLLLAVAGVVVATRASNGHAPPAVFITPSDYVPVPDETSGGGRWDEPTARSFLHSVPPLPGYRYGVLKGFAHKRPPLRAVVILVMRFDTPDDAALVRRGRVSVLRGERHESFAVPEVPDAFGYRDRRPDDAGRYAQRVVFARGPWLYTMSIVTPQPDPDTTELRALVREQWEAAPV